MVEDWPFEARPELAPADYLRTVGQVFAVFDARTQDSGNVSFGVEAAARRWFVKTAGDPADASPFLPHPDRIALLETARRLAASVGHPALPRLQGSLPSAWGPMLVYDWVPGELLRAPSARRDDPASAHQRFRRLPAREIAAALDVVLDAHVALSAQGWVACDFYDGAMIYDFAGQRLSLIDLDSYHQGPFINEMGRMFGSARFMAPEEFERGATIDERTTVFTLGRAISVFLGDGSLDAAAFRGTGAQHAAMTQACREDPAARFESVAALAEAWRCRPCHAWVARPILPP
jgi:serine/threonine-protein kinase